MLLLSPNSQWITSTSESSHADTKAHHPFVIAIGTTKVVP
jgi:hypothetical protein